MSNLVLFFGCTNSNSGHRLIGMDMLPVRDEAWDLRYIPKARHLDGTFFLPRPEHVGHGALTYLPGIDVTILAWWGSPYERRTGANNAIIVSGRADADKCWELFAFTFSKLSHVLTKPLVLAQP